MKKTIASVKTITSVAILMSAASASAIRRPPPHQPAGDEASRPVTERTYCLRTWDHEDGSKQASTCDATASNELRGLTLNQNGCAEGQVALTVTEENIRVRSCPTAVQL